LIVSISRDSSLYSSSALTCPGTIVGNFLLTRPLVFEVFQSPSLDFIHNGSLPCGVFYPPPLWQKSVVPPFPPLKCSGRRFAFYKNPKCLFLTFHFLRSPNHVSRPLLSILAPRPPHAIFSALSQVLCPSPWLHNYFPTSPTGQDLKFHFVSF